MEYEIKSSCGKGCWREKQKSNPSHPLWAYFYVHQLKVLLSFTTCCFLVVFAHRSENLNLPESLGLSFFLAILYSFLGTVRSIKVLLTSRIYVAYLELLLLGNFCYVHNFLHYSLHYSHSCEYQSGVHVICFTASKDKGF